MYCVNEFKITTEILRKHFVKECNNPAAGNCPLTLPDTMCIKKGAKNPAQYALMG